MEKESQTIMKDCNAKQAVALLVPIYCRVLTFYDW